MINIMKNVVADGISQLRVIQALKGKENTEECAYYCLTGKSTAVTNKNNISNSPQKHDIKEKLLSPSDTFIHVVGKLFKHR